ncbi:MAG: DUF692 domain-containing protein, partial [Rhodobacterales bacterium]|nr:DUF692 domain-containing protein [Rhodobacterales bacterium]
PPHYDDILDGDIPDGDGAAAARVDWFEVISENYMVPGGRPLHYLDRIRERWPIVMHGVSLSIGSTDPLDRDYLQDLKALADRVRPAWISDHLCWTGVAGLNMHDLLPLPYTEEALDHVVARVAQVQDYLGRRILLENPSTYITFDTSSLPEWTFMAELARRADCLILLDVNNIYVSAFNHEFDPQTYLEAIPADRVAQIHLAGHQNNGTHIIDTHDHAVIDPVWDLYARAVARLGTVPTMIERDDNIPPLADLVAELDQARQVAAAARKGAAA